MHAGARNQPPSEGNEGNGGSSVTPLPEVSIVGQGIDLTQPHAALPHISFEGTEIVIGVPIDNTGINKATSRVIILASMCATFYIVRFIINLMRNDFELSGNNTRTTTILAAFSSLLIELSVPACGYFGAVYSNRQLTCCFCSCNLLIAIVSIVTCIRDNIKVSELNRQCDQELNAQQRRKCEAWTSNGWEKYMLIISTVVVFFLGCVAFWFGNLLYNRLAGDHLTQSPQVGEVIRLFSSSGSDGGSLSTSSAGATVQSTVPSTAPRTASRDAATVPPVASIGVAPAGETTALTLGDADGDNIRVPRDAQS